MLYTNLKPHQTLTVEGVEVTLKAIDSLNHAALLQVNCKEISVYAGTGHIELPKEAKLHLDSLSLNGQSVKLGIASDTRLNIQYPH